VRGAHVVEPEIDWADLRFDPDAITRWAVAEIARAMEMTLISARPRVVWVFVHYDPYIHHHGYNSNLRSALTDLEHSISDLTRQGYRVIAYSDHGLTGCTAPEELLLKWEGANTSALCWSSPGGAGRIRWSYARPGSEGEVRARLADALQDDALVCSYADLVRMGLFPADEATERKIGSVISVACGPRFPIPNASYRFEHGSFTAEEMFTFFSVWRS
jgi:hypothetical protein